MNYQSGGGFTNQYSVLNQVTNRVDALGNTSYLYNTNGLLQSEDGPWPNDTVSYGYTINRLRQSLSLKNSSGTLLWGQTNSYDAANRLTNLISGAGAFVYQYPTDSASRRVQKLTLANTSFIDNTYDALARLKVTTLKNSTNTVLNTYQYGYNLAGQRASVTNLNANRIDYGYDALGQLTYLTGSESNNTLRCHEQLGYIYDHAGNLTQRNRNQLTTSLTVNNNNQLNTAGQSGSLTVAGRVYGTPTSVTVNDMAANVYSDATFARTNLALPNGATNYTARATNGSVTSIDTVRINLPGTISFQYDDNGNLIRDGQRIMTCDAEDQLVGLVVTDGIYNLTQSGFVYDGLRRLRVRTEASWQGNAWVTNQVVRYVYDGMQVLQEQDGSNQAQVTYTRGLDLSGSFSGAGGVGGLLARSHHSGQTTNHFYYYADGNGNVATLLNASQTVVAEYQYDPFGNLLSMRGVLAEGNLYRFSSKEYHPNSGLYYYGYRFYDPNLQRWLNRDPIGERGEINLYRFVYNNPINLVDPWGLKVVVDANASAEFKNRIGNCICILKQSPNGRRLYDQANNHPNTVVIKEGMEPLTWGELDNDKVFNLDLYPYTPNMVNPSTQKGMTKDHEQTPITATGCAVVLAHELGHALGYSDDPKRAWKGNNVWNNENPVRADFKIGLRLSYHGVSVVP